MAHQTTDPAPDLCPDCAEAIALAKAVHPSAAAGHLGPPLAHDLDLWDEWSLLGDVADHRRRSGVD